MTDPNSVRSDRDEDRRAYPCLVVRMLAGCYQQSAVPGDLTAEDEMIAHAPRVAWAVGLKTCLVPGLQSAVPPTAPIRPRPRRALQQLCAGSRLKRSVWLGELVSPALIGHQIAEQLTG